MMIKSLHVRFLSYFLIFATILILALYFFIVIFLPEHHYRENVDRLTREIYQLDESIGSAPYTSTSDALVNQRASSISALIAVYDLEGVAISSTSYGSQIQAERLAQLRDSERVVFILRDLNMDYLNVLVHQDNYIYRMEIPFQSLEDSEAIMLSFFPFVIAFVALCAIIMSLIFSRRIASPVLKLNQVASSMARLDFNVKWEGKRSDELGQLGQTMNYLTSSLQQAMYQLESELAKEKHLDQMRQEFVSRASHELQTPLALISGHLEAIQDGVVNSEEDIAHYYAIIDQEITKMSRLIRSMLDLSQLEAGVFTIQRETIDYHTLVEDVLDKFNHIKHDKTLFFELHSASSALSVYADEQRLEHVLTNLFQNAVNHAVSDSTISVTLIDKGVDIRTEIYNQGAPINDEDMKHLFERFYKGSTNNAGTGLGLAIVKNIIDHHNGRIGVVNKKDGVCFYFELPKKSSL